MKAAKTQRAFTLIELLVVLTIIALVVAILLPAVQSMRERSRQLQCGNNLRQLGLSLNNYDQIYSCLPQGSSSQGYSSIAAMLPSIEQTNIYNSLNFSLKVATSCNIGGENWTVASTYLTLLVCPSDGSSRFGVQACTNYAGNGGYNIKSMGFNGAFVDRSISLAQRKPISSASIPDGTSNTIAISEWVIGSHTPNNRDPIEAVFNTPKFTNPEQFDLFVDTCKNLNPLKADLASEKRSAWVYGVYGDTLMNFALTPNKNSCLNGGSLNYSGLTASSRHNSGVNSLFVDGHVSNIKNSVNVVVWRALSTRAGFEAISSDDY